MLIDASPFGMNSNGGGGLTPISTAIVETEDDYELFAKSYVTAFRKFRTDDGHTWCSVSGNINGTVAIPSGYRPNKRSVICITSSSSSGGVGIEMYPLDANASAIGLAPSGDLKSVALVGDNIWQVS